MTKATKDVLTGLLRNEHSWVSSNVRKARLAYKEKDMNFRVNEAGETRQSVLDGYERRLALVEAAFKEVDPEWSSVG